MLRGVLGPMEKHHGVRISDAAIVAAVQLSHRYIPARQLPDKAVSLLDTACARVAISQNATPAAIEDTRRAIAAREKEKAGLIAERDLGTADEERIGEIDAEVAALRGAGSRALEARMDLRAGASSAEIRGLARASSARRAATGRSPTTLRGRSAQALREPRDARSRAAHDLRPCRRAGRRLGRLGLDRHSGRPDGQGRGRDRARAAGNPEPARRRPVARPAR